MRHDYNKTVLKVPTMVGFWENSQKSDQMHYFGQNLVGFLSLWRNLEEFSRNSEIYVHDTPLAQTDMYFVTFGSCNPT